MLALRFKGDFNYTTKELRSEDILDRENLIAWGWNGKDQAKRDLIRKKRDISHWEPTLGLHDLLSHTH